MSKKLTLPFSSLTFFKSTAKENKGVCKITPGPALCAEPFREESLHFDVTTLDPLDKMWTEGLPTRAPEGSCSLKGLSVLGQMGC